MLTKHYKIYTLILEILIEKSDEATPMDIFY